ncbi:MAG TPA: hypothetical protein DDZ68_07730 [Parvularcula sp.]|nr:hypothetical protein [Parvularcula sp.]
MKPRLIFYCQHSLGMGHLVRSLALCDALTASFDVTLLNGGRWPDSFARPRDIRVVDLSPIGMAEDASIFSLDGLAIDDAMALRRAAIEANVMDRRPDAVLIELYPFGRKKFRAEIERLIDLSHSAVIASSVRDILVNNRHDQQRHDDRAAAALDERFDCVIVHTDPDFARLEESFRPSRPLATPILYSGFVTPTHGAPPAERRRGVVVSAGGGIVGRDLYEVAIAAAPTVRAATGHETTIVAGPFLPAEDFDAVCDAAQAAGVTVIRQTPNLYAMLLSASVSISQCGYNSALDLLRSGAPAIVVPFVRERETEQIDRARRLSARRFVRLIEPGSLSPDLLAAETIRLAGSPPRCGSGCLNMDGGEQSRRILAGLVEARAGAGGRVGAQ